MPDRNSLYVWLLDQALKVWTSYFLRNIFFTLTKMSLPAVTSESAMAITQIYMKHFSVWLKEMVRTKNVSLCIGLFRSNNGNFYPNREANFFKRKNSVASVSQDSISTCVCKVKFDLFLIFKFLQAFLLFCRAISHHRQKKNFSADLKRQYLLQNDRGECDYA